jgi:hypothetical protein
MSSACCSARLRCRASERTTRALLDEQVVDALQVVPAVSSSRRAVVRRRSR